MDFFTVPAGNQRKTTLASQFKGLIDNPIFRNIMRLSIVALIILTTSIQLISATPAKSQAINEVEISLELKNESLLKAFQKIEAQTPFHFMYRNQDIKDVRNLRIPNSKKSVEAFLKAILANTSLSYRQVDQRILITSSVQESIIPAFKSLNNSNQPSTELLNAFKDVVVRGQVSDDKGPLPGASVRVKGVTTGGIITDAQGRYSITVPDNSTLVFTFVGFLTKEVEVNSQTTINVTLEANITSLEEIVVVGYGVQEKKTLTGSVSSVGSEQLNAVATGDATSRLQGRVAGVTVTGNNDPSGQATVRVRGFGSLGNNNPLYVIDGIPRTSMDNINPNDIESMSVLKDASSSAIYGSRAANGVIVVTTKSGKEGLPRLSFDVRVGMQNKTNSPDLMNSQEIGLNLWQKYKNMGLTVGGTGWGDVQYGFGAAPIVPDYIYPAGKMAGTVDESTYAYPNPYNGITKANKGEVDWYEAVFAPAPIQDYNMSISGGSAGSNYSVSAGFMDQKGIINYQGDPLNAPTHNGFKRYSLRSNSDIKVNNWLKVGPRLSATYTNRMGQGGNGAASGTLTLHPILPIYDIMGNFAGSKTPATGNGQNQIASLVRNRDDYENNLILQGSTYAQVNLTKGLLFRTLLGVSYNTGSSMDRSLANPEFNQANLVSSLSVGSDFGLQYNWTNTVNFLKTIAQDHKVNVLLGTEAFDNRVESVNGGRSTFAFTDLDYMVLNAGEKDITNSGLFNQTRLFSYFGRLNYDYKGKYLLEGVVRRDASSRFVGKYRWGTFPAFSAAWRITEESFMDGVTWLDDLKLRVGWGTNGNDNVGNYNAYSTYVANGNESYYNITGSSRSSSAAGFHQATLGNTEARWETNVAQNLGLDVTMFKSKFEVTLDVYKRVTSDMLYNDSRPGTWGQVTLPQINIGEMKNTGADLILTYRGKAGRDFSYAVNTNLSHFKNKVVKLNNNPAEQRLGNAVEASFNTVTQAGKPLNTFYGYVVEGIFNTAQEVTDWPKFNPNLAGVDVYSQPGVFKYKDVNGDGKITPLDRTFLGDGYPDLSYGFNIDLKYKNFDMTTFLQGLMGRSIINNAKRGILFVRSDGNYLRSRLYESWTAERYASGANITLPITINNDANMSLPNTFFVENGDYFRMKNVQLGYTLPASMLSKIKVNSLRLYLQASNVFTMTKYSGLDVEVNETGIDGSVYPTPRIVVFGLNMKL